MPSMYCLGFLGGYDVSFFRTGSFHWKIFLLVFKKKRQTAFTKMFRVKLSAWLLLAKTSVIFWLFTFSILNLYFIKNWDCVPSHFKLLGVQFFLIYSLRSWTSFLKTSVLCDFLFLLLTKLPRARLYCIISIDCLHQTLLFHMILVVPNYAWPYCFQGAGNEMYEMVTMIDSFLAPCHRSERSTKIQTPWT